MRSPNKRVGHLIPWARDKQVFWPGWEERYRASSCSLAPRGGAESGRQTRRWCNRNWKWNTRPTTWDFLVWWKSNCTLSVCFVRWVFPILLIIVPSLWPSQHIQAFHNGDYSQGLMLTCCRYLETFQQSTFKKADDLIYEEVPGIQRGKTPPSLQKYKNTSALVTFLNSKNDWITKRLPYRTTPGCVQFSLFIIFFTVNMKTLSLLGP